MNARRLTTAFVIALLVSGLCTWALSRKMAVRAAAHAMELRYVAPARPLQPGDILKPDNLELVNWPSANAIAGASVKIDDLVGRSVLYPVDTGQPITERLLSAAGSGVGLSGRIPDGMRAIALRSDEVMGVAGFLLPGSRVDVLVTYHADNTPEPITLTVLQDAEVIAAGQKVQPDPEGKPVTATVVTLLLSPDDAQRAVLASAQGALHFVLRGGSDKAHLQEVPLGLSQLSGTAAKRTEPVASSHPAITHAAAVPAKFVVETISGDKVSDDTFSGVK